MKKTLALILTFIMVLALVPTVAFAEEPYVAWIGEKGYATLGEAVKDAESGDTITLGEGDYSLYDVCGHTGALGSSKDYTAGKDLTFVGQGADKTTYHIGAKDTSHSDGPCDYSLDGRGTEMKETVIFKDMTIDAGKYPEVQTKDAYLHGLAGIDNIVLDNCTFNGIASYWGYATTKFNNVIFNAPGTEASGIEDVDYSLWTWTGTEYTFNNCTFNSAGKVINAYRGNPDGTAENPVGTAGNPIVLKFNDCKVFSSDANKSVLNIKDANNYYTVNISGTNTVKGLNPNEITCSRLFQVEGWAKDYNLSGGEGNGEKCQATVNIDNITVWKDGRMVRHAIDTQNDKYTDGYKDNAFTVEPNGPGSFEVTCDYCGYTETSTGKLYNDIGLTRTVRQNKNSNPVPEDAANSNKYKVANSSNITVDYTATMNMENLRWLVAGKDIEEIQKKLEVSEVKSPWELLMAQPDWITEDTVVFLKFTFDKNINLGTFQTNYNKATTTEAKEKLLKLESNMFEMTGVTFGTDNTMTITCMWNWNKETDPNSTINLKGCGLPVNDNWGGNKIEITNSGCVGGMVHINPMGGAMEAMVEPGSNVAANVQVQNTTPPEISPTIQIPIVGGCKTDEFTLYYGGGSSGDSSGGSSSGGGYYYPTTTPVPVIVIPPKTGDMTVWQSILHFFGIK